MKPTPEFPCPDCAGSNLAICERVPSRKKFVICKDCRRRGPETMDAETAVAMWDLRAKVIADRIERKAKRRLMNGNHDTRKELWSDEIIQADIVDRFVRYGHLTEDDAGNLYVLHAPVGGQEREMNVQAFILYYLAPRYNFEPKVHNDESRVEAILRRAGKSPRLYPPERRPPGVRERPYHPQEPVLGAAA